jgi:hypothetical protein
MKSIYHFPVAVFIASLFLSQGIEAQTVYFYKNGEDLREYCRKEFGKSNLWQALLLYNGYSGTEEVKGGSKLTIPDKTIQRYLKAEANLRERFSKSIGNGAKIFATDKVDKIEAYFTEAEKAFKTGKFKEARKLQQKLDRELSETEKICEEASNHKVEAKVYDMRGNVDRQPAGVFTWKKLHTHDALMEKDKVRTLKNSFADIIFKDESHIFLDENSMMLIKKMRENRLNSRKSSSVVLVKGDLQALLLSASSKDFSLKIPEVKTDIKSNSFWMRREENKDVKISNYNGSIEIASAGKAVTIKKNEGVKVKYKSQPSQPVRLLDPPKNLTVRKGKNGYVLFWDKVNGAKYYQLQVSGDRLFQKQIVAVKKTGKNKTAVSNLSEGIYFWRVRSFSKDDLPGNYSYPAQLIYRKNTSRPFLAFNKKINGDSLELEIETQAGNTVSVNGIKTATAEKKLTVLTVPLTEGKNEIYIEVTSPYGEKSRKSFSLIHSGKPSVIFSYPKTTDTDKAVISGRFDKDYRVVFDGREFMTKNSKMKKIVALRPGMNLFPVKVMEKSTDTVIYSDTLKIYYDKPE